MVEIANHKGDIVWPMSQVYYGGLNQGMSGFSGYWKAKKG